MSWAAGICTLKDQQLAGEQCSNPAWPVCPTPLWMSNWRQITESYPKAYAAYVSQGLHSGFRIGFSCQDALLRPLVHNPPTHPVSENGQTVRDYITTEVLWWVLLLVPFPRRIIHCTALSIPSFTLLARGKETFSTVLGLT